MNEITRQQNRVDTVNELLADVTITEWEEQFLINLRDQLFRTMKMTDKQIEKFREIRKKVKGF